MVLQESRLPFSENASTDTEPFSYKRVPWISGAPNEGPAIRLLELASWRNQTSHLHGKLFWTPLSSPVVIPYTALSYAWAAGGGFTSMMCVNGQMLEITGSLEQALKHLQRPTEPLIIWIDQISIDQQNNEEKSQQVAQMGKIYQAAEETLVWLGPAENNSDLFMHVLEKIGRDAESWGMMDYYTHEQYPTFMRIVGNVDPHDPRTIEFNEICRRAAPSFTLEFLNAMARWHSRPWFSRTWVLQEFSLTRKATFVCGYQRLSAEQAFLAHQVFDYCHGNMPAVADVTYRDIIHTVGENSVYPLFKTREQRKRIVAGRERGVKLYELLWTIHVNNRMKATEPCDLIWGLLALAVDRDQPEFQADYDRKDQVELIYTQVTKAIIEKDSLDIIKFSQFPKRFHRLPSWAPDWSANPHSSFTAALDMFKTQFAASKDLPLGLLHSNEFGILGLRGFTIDQIENIGTKWQVGDTYNMMDVGKQFKFLTEVQDFCRLSDIKDHNIYASQTRRAEAQWRVPIGDIQRKAGAYPCRAESSCAIAYRDAMIQLEYASLVRQNLPGNYESLEKAYYDTRTGNPSDEYRLGMHVCNNKRPFLSISGYVGIGPVYMQPGDIIVVFKGATIPYIVRLLEEEKYTFIGECYCDGIMDGENLESRQEEDFYLL